MILGALARRLARVSGKLDTSVAYLTMWDSITPSVLPSSKDDAYLGYVDGRWPTFSEVKAKFPDHHVIDMAVFSSGNATGLDIENGDATVSEAPGWHDRQVVRGVWRPVLYIQASNMRALEQAMTRAHIQRSSYRLFTAHYTGKAHLCSPKTCGYGLTGADATQWTQNALGLNLDRSVLLPDFFAVRPAPRPPAPTPTPAVVPAWQEDMMNSLPTLRQGDPADAHGRVYFIHRMQALIRVIGQINNIESASSLAADGDFGLKTANALQDIHAFFHITGSEFDNRECGPETWAALVTGEK